MSQKNNNEAPTGYCRKCGVPLENGVCPKCGFKAYVPMDKKKAFWIRMILGAVMIVGLIIFVILKDR